MINNSWMVWHQSNFLTLFSVFGIAGWLTVIAFSMWYSPDLHEPLTLSSKTTSLSLKTGPDNIWDPYNKTLLFPFIKLITFCTNKCICVITWLMSLLLLNKKYHVVRGCIYLIHHCISAFSRVLGTWRGSRRLEWMKPWERICWVRVQLCLLGQTESSLRNQPHINLFHSDMLMWICFPGHPVV